MATSQVRSSISYDGSGSTSQLCLKKIINIITTHSSSVQAIQPSEITKTSTLNLKFDSEVMVCEEKSSCRSSCCGKRGFDIDLNLRLGTALDTEANPAEYGGFSGCSSVGEAVCGIGAKNSGDSAVEKSSEGECDPKETVNSSGDFSAVETNKGGKREVVEEETKEFSAITNLRVQSPEIETEDAEQNEIEEEKKVQRRNRDCKSEGYLGLLVEAARLVSGNFEDEEEPESDQPNQNNRTKEESSILQCGSKRNRWWTLELYEDFEDISPVVRSKRGRNQVLPYRYRDSVLEPLRRLSSKHRSSRVSAKPKMN